MNQSIHLNNIGGANYTETGDFEQAIASLTEALRMETTQYELTNLQVDKDRTTMAETDNLDRFFMVPYLSQIAPTTNSHDNGYIYNKCIKIPTASSKNR
jgi:hypothetical protein